MNGDSPIFQSLSAGLIALTLTGLVLLLFAPAIRRILAETRERDGGFFAWSSGEVSITALGMLFFCIQLTLVGVFLRQTGWLRSVERQAVFLIAGQTANFIFLLFLVAWILRQRQVAIREAFGLSNGRWSRVAAMGAGGTAIVLAPMMLAAWGTQCLLKLLDWPIEPQGIVRLIARLHDWNLLALITVITVIGAPIVEEAIFRGIFYPFLKGKVGFWHAIWISSLVFAAIHGNLPSLLPLFVLAIALSLLYEWKRNLLAPVICHATFNAISLAFIFCAPDA
jgi:membrane protease YdiL (CAAX protease family)